MKHVDVFQLKKLITLFSNDVIITHHDVYKISDVEGEYMLDMKKVHIFFWWL